MSTEFALDFAADNTTYATHAIHAFAAKCPPQLAQWGINLYSKPGDIVLDPFCGSGTTLAEALLLGRRSFGLDIDPLARLISTVKSTPLADGDAMSRQCEQLIATIEGIEQPACDPYTSFAGMSGLPDAQRWFLPQVALDLMIVKEAIAAALVADEVRRFFYIAFSSLITARSSVVNARDIVHSRYHYLEHPHPPQVKTLFAQRLRRLVRQMAEFASRCRRYPNVSSKVIGNDARALPLADQSCDLVFTSPPYCDAIHYPRAHRFSIAWLQDVLGISYRDYVAGAREYIGTTNQRGNPSLPQVGLREADRIVAEICEFDRAKAHTIANYFIDMRLALAEMARVMKRGAQAILVVCPSHTRKLEVPSHRLLAAMAEQLNLKHIATHERTIYDNRRLLPYMQEAFGQRMRAEYVIVLQKP